MPTTTNLDLDGFKVEARDGSIGTVDHSIYVAGMTFVVVSSGRKLMIPAGVIEEVDPDTETVFVGLTKDEIATAPEFDEQYRDPSYRS